MINLRINEKQIEYKSDHVEFLSTIDLSKDVVIVAPESDENLDFRFTNSQFELFTRTELWPDKFGRYLFYPRIKMSLPVGMKDNYINRILGLSIIHYDFETTDGYYLNSQLPLTDIIIQSSNVLGRYTIVKNMQIHLKEYNRDFLLRSLGARLNITPGIPVVNMHFVPSFTGISDFIYNELIVIKSDYIYNNFPFPATYEY